MCGITGIFTKDQPSLNTLNLMTSSLIHRGPDGFGLFTFEHIGLGHTRLAIQELTDLGKQPMVSENGRYVVSFNGEIYNHFELRKKINHLWKGRSDTETLLVHIEKFGIKKTLHALVGMFAFALYDKHEKCVYLARDRTGEKPIYFGYSGRDFIFASELKSLCNHAHFDKSLSPQGIYQFIKHSQIPCPHTIFKNIFKLRPGHFLKVKLADVTDRNIPQSNAYWSMINVAKQGQEQPFDGSFSEAKSIFSEYFSKAIKGQIIADVPVGCFLSGGIDSSLTAAFLQNISGHKINSFCAGFELDNFNEARFAKEVAHHLGLIHNEICVSENDALDVIPNLPNIFCEPFGDISAIPTYLISKVASQKVKVVLSGDGGDEIMGGYARYKMSRYLLLIQIINQMGMSNPCASLLNKIPTNILKKIETVFFKEGKELDLKVKFEKLTDMIISSDIETAYSKMIAHWHRPENALTNRNKFFEINKNLGLSNFSIKEQMMLMDTQNYLPNDILVKVDRSSMASGLECRAPFLDHNLIEFCWSLPQEFKFKNGVGKHLTREVLFDFVPKSLLDRPKAGFSAPIGFWLRGKLREWAEDLLSEKKLDETGILDKAAVRAMWKEHLNGSQNREFQLWGPLMIQAWADQNL